MSDLEYGIQDCRLVLEDGTIFHGRGFGSSVNPVTVAGEVVFNTAMCGYQECLSDPSYLGQILVMTAPMIGNYGTCTLDVESEGPAVSGFAVRELSRMHSNYRSDSSLDQWLARGGGPAIEGIDTRALVRRLRSAGVMRGVISSDSSIGNEQLVSLAGSAEQMAGKNLAAEASSMRSEQWNDGLDGWCRPSPLQVDDVKPLKVLAIDCGAKRAIYRHLVDRGCDVRIVPHDITASDIRAAEPDGLFISNGPGDPSAVQETIAVLAEVAGEFPTFGICLGHQLLALAIGASTWKLKFGHRGANQPVRNLMNNQVEITSQNHGFCVDEEALESAGGTPPHRHLNDGTIAGFRHLTKPIFSVQYHPEASPGPHDSSYLFDCFIQMMRTGQPLSPGLLEEIATSGGLKQDPEPV